MLRLPDGTMAIACGGILTDPDRGRAKLEIATTRPNRARLDPAAGAVPSPGLPPMPAAGLAFGNHRIAP